jgi:hypothetical protein
MDSGRGENWRVSFRMRERRLAATNVSPYTTERLSPDRVIRRETQQRHWLVRSACCVTLVVAIAVAVLGVRVASAQRPPIIRLRGQTIDSVGAPVRDVRVQLQPTGRETYSDSTGMFVFDSVPSVEVLLSVSHPQFERLMLAIPGATDDTTIVPVMMHAAEIPAPGDVQAGSLYGVILDAGGLPIADAEVFIATAASEARSDSMGRFAMPPLAPAQHYVRVRKLGFFVQFFAIATSPTTAARLRVVMERVAPRLDAVEVRADYVPQRLRAFMERIQRLPARDFMTRSQIQARAAVQLSDLLGSIPGIRIDYNNAGQRVVLWRTGCEVRVMVNARLMLLDGVMLDTMLRPTELFGLEVYPPASYRPAEFSFAPTGCALVGIWTE